MELGVGELAGTFYEGSLDAGMWERGMAALAGFAGARGAVFTVEDMRAGRSTVLHQCGQSAEAIESYHREFHKLAPLMRRAPGLPPGEWQDWLHRDPSHRQSTYYNEFLVPHGNHAGIATVLGEEDGRYACLGLQRSAGQGSFTADDRQRLEPLMPHLRRAARMYFNTERLREQGRVGSAALDGVALPIFVVDAQSAIVLANRVAEDLCRKGREFASTGKRLSSCAHDAALQASIQRATHASAPEGSVLRLPPAGGQPAALLTVAPVSAASALARPWQRPLALVMAGGTGEHSLAATLQQVFGVTPAEARLGVGLADGLSMAEIAERHDVKVQTLRSQLKSLFWKVGVRRQAELVRQLAALQCMAPHGHPPA